MTSEFPARHIGPSPADVSTMLKTLSLGSVDELLNQVVPGSILDTGKLAVPPGLDEHEALTSLQQLAAQNKVVRTLLGQGYYDCHTPAVIRRCVLESPGWYTAYTPYQPEIAQGRLEVLFNFQTLITELTGLPIANASLLDEATAAAESVALAHRTARGKKNTVLVDEGCHPQTLAVLKTRTESLDIHIQLVPVANMAEHLGKDAADVFAVVTQ